VKTQCYANQPESGEARVAGSNSGGGEGNRAIVFRLKEKIPVEILNTVNRSV
jgi:hypothetical protein